MKIGEVVSGSVSGGLEAKLELENPEDLRIGYPVIVEGKRYNYYCLVHDIVNEPSDIAERLAGSVARDKIVPMHHEGFSGRIFYSKALLRPIQIIDKASGGLSTAETIPPYFAEARHASREDVELIYEVTETSAPLGTIRGVDRFYVHVDMGRLVEKPFAIFGRTGVGKSILNKLVCCSILARSVGSVLVFDMHGEYGVYSRTDGTEGLQYFHPHRIEAFSLDGRDPKARPFLLDPAEIDPDDLVVAFQEDLSPAMVDAIYEINRRRGKVDLISAIRAEEVDEGDQAAVHGATLGALKRRMQRLERLPFLRPGAKDAFGQILQLLQQGKSIILDFGEFGTDSMVYLFVANVLARRLFNVYTEGDEGLPRLVVFLEEAHRFLDPAVAPYTIFSKLARETRKFNLILALVDQRPSRIDDEVRSQLANRLVLSLKEPSDVQAALAGVPDRSMWEAIVSTMPGRTVAILGDAIRVPTVLDVLEYNDMNVREQIMPGAVTERKLQEIAKRAADQLFEDR
jgi:hypothetical protein